MGNEVRREGTRWVIHYDGATYPSIIQFCDAYGLKVSTVQKQFINGKTPEQVIQAKNTKHKKVPMKATSKQYPCTVDGIEYPSMSAAAASLGIPLYWLYAFKKKHSYDAQTAVQEAVKIYTPEKGNQNSDKQKPCVVDGIEYASRTAACKAYGTPLITVYSKCERDGIHFEEALSLINRSKKRLPAPQRKAKKLSLKTITRENIKNDRHVIHRAIKSFEARDYQFECFENVTGELVLKVKEQLHSNSQAFDVYIIFPVLNREPQIIVEFFVPELLNIPAEVNQAALDAQLLDMNENHLMSKIIYRKDTHFISISGSQVTRQQSQTDGSMIPALFYFLSDCENILSELQEWLDAN